MKFLIIGITGMSGAGKSTLAKEICKLNGAEIIDADKLAHDLQRPRRGIL